MPPMSSMSTLPSDTSLRRYPSKSTSNEVEKRAMQEQQCNPMEGRNPRRRRRKNATVTFSATDELQEIPHINDLSDEEVSSVWMTREELQAIRRQCATIVKFMDMDSAAQHGVCLRGLEQNTPNYVAIQVEIRRQLYDAVHAIQDFQYSTGMQLPDMLAESCQKFSHDSVIQAQIVGMNDASYVQSMLKMQ